jgi:hypothetical protein
MGVLKRHNTLLGQRYILHATQNDMHGHKIYQNHSECTTQNSIMFIIELLIVKYLLNSQVPRHRLAFFEKLLEIVLQEQVAPRMLIPFTHRALHEDIYKPKLPME